MIRPDTLSLVWSVDGMSPSTRVSFADVRASLQAASPHYEIVLVTRDVSSLSQHFVGADPHTTVIVPARGGDGAAITSGCAASRGEYLLVISGDAVPDWGALRSLVPFLERSDIVAAFRVRSSQREIVRSRLDTLLPAVFAFLFGITLRDPFNPAKLYRAELLRGLTFVSSGAALSLELLAKARTQGAIVTEVGIATPLGVSDEVPVSRWASSALRLWLHLRRFRTPWTVRTQPPMVHPPSVYAVWGVVLTILLWLVRGRFVRVQADRR